MNSVLSSLREVLSQRNIRVIEAPVWVTLIQPDGTFRSTKWTVRADDSGNFDTVVYTYRGIREVFLKEVSPAAWIRGKGPYILNRVLTLGCLAASEGGNAEPIIELDLRRPADDMFGVVFGSAGFTSEYLSDPLNEAFPLNASAVPYRGRVSGRLLHVKDKLDSLDKANQSVFSTSRKPPQKRGLVDPRKVDWQVPNFWGVRD